jgi:dihydrofolate reductase
MRKLKLQVQITVDGFVAGPNGENDWMTPINHSDEQQTAYVKAIMDSFDTILLGRKMNDGFVDYWTKMLENPESPVYSTARKMVNTPKVVFSKTISESTWANTIVANGDLVEEVEKLKQQDGKDIIVYGGANFVSNLIRENLIDEFYLVVNPTAIGRGMTIFGNLADGLKLKLVQSVAFSNGKVVNHYELEK